MVQPISVDILKCQIVGWWRIDRIIINLNYIQPIRVEQIDIDQLIRLRNRKKIIIYQVSFKKVQIK